MHASDPMSRQPLLMSQRGIFEPQREKTYLWTCAPKEDSDQPANTRSLISLCCPHEETLHPWLSKIRPVKVLIRLRECAGWSESSLGAHVRRYVFWRYGSFILHGITKTCLYNFDPLKPHFHIVKLGFTGVYIIFLFSAQKHRLWVLVRTASVLTSTHNLFFEQKYEKYQNFYPKTFSFWWWNFQYIWIGVFS